MLGVCYYPEHWPEAMWAQDAKEMRELGLNYVRIAEFSWSRIQPKPNLYQFAWLDKAIDTLAAEGMKVVLCTPTATPPKWLIDKYPDILPVDINTGLNRGFGSRRHADFSSQNYFNASMEITEKLAQRYANYPGVVGWQTDNELACHDTTHSASTNALKAFRIWCKQRYGTINELNQSWGTVFWSMEYQSFDEIELPLFSVTEAHPSHQLAYRRFSSDQVIKFHNELVSILRRYCPTHFVTHNFIPMADTQCDNFALAETLDFAAYDNYPLGRTDVFFGEHDQQVANRYMRTGHPDYACYSFDQIRAISKGNFWIMEQQPGPVNWGYHNPRPERGMVKLWSWEAIGHGASTISYFRWRQVPFAQEQMHAGIKRVDNSRAQAWDEITALRKEILASELDLNTEVTASVAIIMDIHNQWVTEIERQADSYEHQRVEFAYYSALRQLGINVDFISQDDDIAQYKVLVAPCLPIVSDDFVNKCSGAGVHLVCGPRSGSKTDELRLVPDLAPGKLKTLIALNVLSVETLRESCTQDITYNNKQYKGFSWLEELQVMGDTETLAHYTNGGSAIVQNTHLTYIGALIDAPLLLCLLKDILVKHNVNMIALPEDVRLVQRGNYGILCNYGATIASVSLDFAVQFVVGSKDIAPRDVAVFKRI